MRTTTRTILKKTRRGNVARMIRERYLRDDIPCGSALCEICQYDQTPLVGPRLSSTPRQLPDILQGRPHYVMVDASVAFHQIDVWEHVEMKDVILLSSVLAQVKDKSLPVHDRLRALAANKDRSFYVFSNDFHATAFVERQKGESLEDYRHRLVHSSIHWYQQHQTVSIVLICNVEVDQKKAQSVGIDSVTLAEYADAMKHIVPELVDILADQAESQDAVEKESYADYLYQAQLQSGIKSGTLQQGKLSISMHNLFEGSIHSTIDGQDCTIQIVGRINLNRAIHDDIVVVQLLPREQWSSVQADSTIDEDGDKNADVTLTSQIAKTQDKMEIEEDVTPVGMVVGVIRRNWRAYCGSIDPESARSGVSATSFVSQPVWFYPMDRRVPRIRIRTRQAHKLIGCRVIVNVDAWEKDSAYPRGHYVRSLGAAGDKRTEVEVLLMEHDVQFQPFSAEVLSSLPAEGEDWIVRDEHLFDRQDFRDLTICSIDPPGCTDIDDALHCRLLSNGNFEAGVHIADVTHFVKPSNAMDTEAAKRGTTVYLVDKRIDMLPPLLGTNLCSLRCNVDRLAFSVIWELTPEGDIVSTRFTKSIIRSHASLTYNEAQSRMDDKSMNDDVTKSIRYLNQLAKKLRHKRTEAGSLTLSSPEVRFQLEHDSQDPVDVELKELKDTNALVEDFMLLANISVAKKITEKFPESAVLRRHPRPPITNFDGLKKSLDQFGIVINAETSKRLAESLDQAILPTDAYFNKLIRILTTRCMMQAVYFCSGSEPENEFWHYGLASDIYTHFTSPIRRYADVMVHRLLHASISESVELLDPTLLDRVKTVEVCANLNYRHRMAQQAGRSSVELYTNLFFRDKVVVEEGYVMRVMRNGFAVLVPKYGIEGFVYTTTNATPTTPSMTHMDFDAEIPSLTCGDIVIRALSKVKVHIRVDSSGAAGLRQRLRMHLIDPEIEGMLPSEDTK